MHAAQSPIRQTSLRSQIWTRLATTLLLLLIVVTTTNAQRTAYRLSAADEAFLEDLSRRSFRFFWEQADPETGLVADRARANGEPYNQEHRSIDIASSAATGFGLTALCIAAERGWIDRKAARDRVMTTLRFYAERSPHQNGWFYHFVDRKTGERRWRSEISTIDTALLLGGVLTVRQYFHADPEIVRLATLIYERVDFPYMLAGNSLLLSHGWRPETGFIKHTWNHYSEHTILQLLAIGSPAHPIKPSAWLAWHRLRLTFGDYTYLTFRHAPLFVHQYSQAWVDYRDLEESWYPYTNYFENSVKATLAHREFCLSLSDRFPGYTENVWGITASDSAKGYRAWGGPPPTRDIDGTVVPCAPGGSLMFTPEITLAALKTMHERWGDQIYQHYGFVDAFNPNNGWVNRDVIGIDVGITLLSAENLRTGNVWRWFMRNREIPRAMRLVGFRRVQRRSRPAAKVSAGGIAPISFSPSPARHSLASHRAAQPQMEWRRCSLVPFSHRAAAADGGYHAGKPLIFTDGFEDRNHGFAARCEAGLSPAGLVIPNFAAMPPVRAVPYHPPDPVRAV